MRTADEVVRFQQELLEKFGDNDPTGAYFLKCFESGIPKSFWECSSEQVSKDNLDVFNEVILKYCKRRKRAQRHGYSLMFNGDNGTGKRQPLSTLVMTPEGLKLLGDVKVGDQLIGSNGKPVKVLKLHPIVYSKIYQITFSDGRKAYSDAGHLWTFDVAKFGSQGKRREPERSTRTLEQWMKMPLLHKGDRTLWLPIMTGPVLYSSAPDLPIDPYTMGVLLGDGSFRNCSPTLAIGDLDLDILENLVLPDPIDTSKRSQKPGCVEVSLCTSVQGRKSQNTLTNILRELELWGLSSADKFIPEGYLRARSDQRLSLLRGLLDTDGSPSKLSASFSSYSGALANGVRDLFEGLGGVARLSKYGDEYQVVGKLPQGLEPFVCKRKLGIWAAYKGRTDFARQPKRSVISIEAVEDEFCRCITVDAEDGLYAIEGSILTHNTFFSCFVLTQMIKRGCSAYYTTLPELDADMKRSFEDKAWGERLRRALDSDFLAIDEVGKEHYKMDSFIRTNFEMILKRRYDDGDPVLLATNQDIESLYKMYGLSMSSIWDGKYLKVALSPGDHRAKMVGKMYTDLGLR